jgi:hypothetical protein
MKESTKNLAILQVLSLEAKSYTCRMGYPDSYYCKGSRKLRRYYKRQVNKGHRRLAKADLRFPYWD